VNKPGHVLEIYLQPGELWFGDRNTRVRTLLGSCVALTLWHPQHLIGGMCHFMLPGRAGKQAQPLDGRYADEAVDLLLAEIRKNGTQSADYEAKLFGGGCMFHHPFCDGVACVGQVPDRNIAAARALVARHGFRFKAEHIGGQGHRQLIFDIWSGQAWMKHTPLPAEARCRLEAAPQ